jgi:acyl-CoA thioesterase FadM
LAAVGFGLDVMSEAGFQIVLVELTARFFASATLHEDLIIETAVTDVSRASSRWSQKIMRGDQLIATLEVRAAFTDRTGKLSRPPPGFADAMSAI